MTCSFLAYFLLSQLHVADVLDSLSCWERISPYLIFVTFFTRAKFLDNKIYTKKRQFFALNL